jgi:hypothetical protein
MQASMLEIYNETLRDLLVPSSVQKVRAVSLTLGNPLRPSQRIVNGGVPKFLKENHVFWSGAASSL